MNCWIHDRFCHGEVYNTEANTRHAGASTRLFRFIHAADIHLDSPLRGLERYEGAPVEEIRAAPRRAFENLVEFAIEEGVSFLLLSGDLYDGDWRDYNTGLFFVAQMQRLADADISVHVIAGNHDAASQITRRLTLPENVTLYASKAPQTIEIEELNVAIHGQSFEHRSEQDDLAANYPPAIGGRFEIGLLHTSLGGYAEHDVYAPTSVEMLKSKGYDYWALGHVHARKEIAKDPWIVFPGNLQGRHARELGPKGATLVEVVDGRVSGVSHRAFDVVRWARVEVEVPAEASAAETLDLVRERLEAAAAKAGRLLVVRLRLGGRCAAHATLTADRERWVQEYRAVAMELRGEGVFLERVSFETEPVFDTDSLMTRDDALGDLMRRLSVFDALSDPSSEGSFEDALLEAGGVGERLADLATRLPPELLRADPELGGFDPREPSQLRALMPEVRVLLRSALMEAVNAGQREAGSS